MATPFVTNLPIPLIPNVPIPQQPKIPTLPSSSVLQSFSNSSVVKCLGVPSLPSIPPISPILILFGALAALAKLAVPAIPNISLTPEIMVTVNCVPPISFSANFTTNSIPNPASILTQLENSV